LSVKASADNSAVPTTVNLRIEAATYTIFEGPIFTHGHKVTTASGGTHPCDGTNNNANPTPGPTVTSALDDASKLHHFSWDGTFSTEFDDYFVTTIANQAQTSTKFWGILLNYQFIPVGGCQQEVKRMDDVLFAFDAFNKVNFLKLTGPGYVHVGHPVILTVTDGQNGSPVAGAEVNGQTSDANGHVSVTFKSPGTQKVKAEKSDSVRSAALTIEVV
ncbi:hypothetical protein F5887DRAFT_836085, partial [Amanita rubescens]